MRSGRKEAFAGDWFTVTRHLALKRRTSHSPRWFVYSVRFSKIEKSYGGNLEARIFAPRPCLRKMPWEQFGGAGCFQSH
jgi:hypothetical protein